MLKLIKNKKAQNTAEYAILIALVVGAVIAMQTYVQRGLQARTRGTSLYMQDQISTTLAATDTNGVVVGKTNQYNPYYQDTQYTSTRNNLETETASPTYIGKEGASNRSRAGADDLANPTQGYDRTLYNTAIGAIGQD